MNVFGLEDISLYYSIGGVFLIVVFLLIVFRIKFNRNRTLHLKKSNAYVDALNELIAGNNNRAMNLLKAAVRFDTNNIDAYIKLGMLCRIQNSPQQALKIHKELTIRSGLSDNQLIEIYRNIISDYIELNLYNDALRYCDKLLELDVKNAWALEIQPTIYEYKKDFKNAFKYLQSNAINSTEINHKLALYKIAYGLNLVNKGEYHDARIIFKEAIKLDRDFPAAYLYLGDAYAREKRQEDALKVWKEFADTVPQKSYLVFDYINAAYFDSGNYNAMEGFYSSIIEKDTDNFLALLRLGELYFKKGEREKALELTERGLKINPNSADGLKNLIMYLNNSEDIQVIKEKALSLAEMVTDSTSYLCRYCQFATTNILIQCPSCEKWDAFDF